MRCESCGIPDDAYTDPGYKLKLWYVRAKEEGLRRAFYEERSKTVWVCTARCAILEMAVAGMGLPSYNWPLKLDEFTARMKAAGKLEFLEKRQKPPLRTRENIEVHEVRNMNMEELQAGTFRPRTGGRPKTRNPRAGTRRQRRYEARKKLTKDE